MHHSLLKFNHNALVIVVAVTTFMTTGRDSCAKPIPPPQLAIMLNMFEDLETNLESSNWTKAIAPLKAITDSFNGLLPILNKDVAPELIKGASVALENLKKSVYGRTKDRAGQDKLVAQKFIFSIMNNYSYKLHPMLQTIKAYIGEAKDAYEKKDFENVTSELREVAIFWKMAEELAVEHNVPTSKIQQFQDALKSASKAGNAKNPEEIKHALSGLEASFKTIMEGCKNADLAIASKKE